MHKKLNENEVKQLFVFCHKHYVYQYDLQTELVDHLGSAIEDQWESNPELPFQEALKNCWVRFGIHGFSKIKQQKEKELRRKYNVLVWKYLLDFYKWPKMIMTIMFTLALFSIIKYTGEGFIVMMFYFGLISILMIAYYYYIFPRYFKINTKPGKSFLLLNVLRDLQVVGGFVAIMPIYIYNIGNSFNWDWIQNSWILFAISLFTISLTIVIYENFFIIPKKIKEHFMESYAEYAL